MAKVFIYGSCVSRDPFEAAEKHTLVDYFARSSIGSAFRDAPAPSPDFPDVSTLPSAFQRRMVASDINKTLAHTIGAAEFDVMVLDFIDERMNTIEFGGSTITESAELKATGFGIDPATSFEPWTETGWAHRAAGIQALAALVDPGKIVVNKAYWAHEDSNGETFEYKRWIDTNNSFLERLYSEIGKIPGIRFITYPDGVLVADADHKWGRMAYHFTAEANQHFLTELDRITAAS